MTYLCSVQPTVRNLGHKITVMPLLNSATEDPGAGFRTEVTWTLLLVAPVSGVLYNM